MHYTGHHIHTLWQQSLLFMTSHVLYSWHHTHYIWHVIYCVWYHILSMCDCSQCLFLWHHTLYLYDKSTLYGIKHSVMTIQPLCTSQPLCLISHTMIVSSHPMYQFYQTQCMYAITSTICMKTYVIHMISHPLFMTSHHFVYDIKSTLYDIISTISDFTSTVSVSSHPLYQWYHSQYMYDRTSSICVRSYPLYLWHHTHYVWHHNTVCWWHHTRHIYDIIALQMTSDPLYQNKPHYSWCHIHFRHDISPILSDIEPTVSLSSQPLHWYHSHICMTSHPLSVWDHMHYI